MEKHGVVEGEGETPAPDVKKASDRSLGCGDDTASRLAEKAAEAIDQASAKTIPFATLPRHVR